MRGYGMGSAIQYEERDGGVLWCTFANTNRANAINPSIVSDLDAVLLYVDDHPNIVTVVLSAGDTRHFCAGGDLNYLAELSTEQAAQFADSVFDICRRIERSPAVWCAMLKGAVLGGGAELALAFDIRFAHTDTRFSLSQLKMGLSCGWGGFGRLVRLVGRTRALKWVLGASELDITDLASAGLAETILQEDEAECVAAWRAEWCTQDLNTLRGAITVLKNDGGREQERAVFERLWKSCAHQRALDAFLQKR